MADEGASAAELVLEACRRNNIELLDEVLASVKPPSSGTKRAASSDSLTPKEEAVANLLNNTRDGMGNAPLHIASSAGSYDIIDVILDQPGVETDPLDRLHKESPLHKAVHFANTFEPPKPRLDPSSPSPSARLSLDTTSPAHAIVEILVDAGCDPRLRSKGGMKAVDLVDPRDTGLREFLRRAELILNEGLAGRATDVVNEDEDDEDGGSPSDSD